MQRKRPLPGIRGGPQQADFPGFRGDEKRENRKVRTPLPCLPLFSTAKEEERLMPRKRTEISSVVIYHDLLSRILPFAESHSC